MSLTLALTVLLVYRCHTSAIKWDYDEPHNNVSDWVTYWPECGGEHQSPINIIDTSECNELLTLDWISQSSHFGIRNNGHTLHAIPFEISHHGGSDISGLEILHHTNDTNIRLKNSFYNTYKSPVNSEYCFDSLHFHWGTTSEFGSEHAINGQHFPLELHLVHYSCDYYTVGSALNAYESGQTDDYDDGNILAVIAVLFEIDDEPNPVLNKILSDVILSGVLEYIDIEDADENLLQLFYTEFDIMDLLPTNKQMFAYTGSLTTPPCYETVRWHIMKEKMSVSQTQLDLFRSILESTADLNDNMAPNWRPLQEMHDRSLYSCVESVTAESVEKEVVNVYNVEESVNDYYNEYRSWFVVGVLFICLFVVSLLIVGYLSYLLYKIRGKGGSKGKYHKGRSGSGAGDAEEMNVVNTEDYH